MHAGCGCVLSTTTYINWELQKLISDLAQLAQKTNYQFDSIVDGAGASES